VLPVDRDLSGPDGLADAQMFLNSRRLFQVCPLVGTMRRMIEVSVRHLDTVIREGRPLTQSPAVQGRLGSMYAKYLTSRVILHDARPRLRPVLLDSAGNLRRSHQMFLNGESMHLRYYSDPRARAALPTEPADSIYFLTAIAGG
jgi:alkylation response protein AidB-like acyl-CoA dehydrogenase